METLVDVLRFTRSTCGWLFFFAVHTREPRHHQHAPLYPCADDQDDLSLANEAEDPQWVFRGLLVTFEKAT